MQKISNTNGQSNPGDRFIPSRACHSSDFSNYILHNNEEDDSIDSINDEMRYKNYGHYQLVKKRFQEQLWKLMAPKSRKILNFCKYSTDKKNANIFQNIWPVIPRKKACIMSPIRILDLAEVEMNICYNLIDWSSKGDLATIIRDEVHVWRPDKKQTSFSKIEAQVEHCVKFNIDGTLIAMAVANSSMLITDVATYKTFSVVPCCKGKIKKCSIGCMEWLRGDTLITGCTNGMLLCWNTKFDSAIGRHAHKGTILAIRKSCRQQYLATSGLDGKLIVWTLPSIENLYEVQFFSPVKAFDWHPWREPLLASSGGLTNNILTLWNVTSMQQEYSYHAYQDMIIDALTFNKLSGEMVISYYDQYKKKNTIHVLASFTTVVDVIECHIARVPYLLWSGDNSQLLTAGADENLCIWDFFDTKLKKRSEKKKLSLNSIENLNAFRLCIR